MTSAVEILILGDSALASLGGVFPNALDLLAENGRYQRDVHLLNGSTVGMTAADAWWHFVRTTRRNRIDAVVVHVGNCDACGYGTLKPAAPRPLAAFVARQSTAWHHRRNPMSRRNTPLEFVVHDIAARPLRRCVTPGACAGFIRKIAARAQARKQHVFIIIPESKTRFPPANNTGNFAFYTVFGVHDALAFRTGGATRLVEALRLQSAGRFDEAAALYDEIAGVHRGTELGAIAANNLAAICFDRGEYEGAARHLDLGTAPPAPLRPLLAFNRAVLAEKTGDLDRAGQLFRQAREDDAGTYRITGAYQDALAQVEESRYVHRIDLRDVLSDGDFIDYCHPTGDGHRRLAAALQGAMETHLDLGAGVRPPRLSSRPLNPDAYAGAPGGFFEHFGVMSAGDVGFAAAACSAAESQPYATTIQRDAFAGGSPRDRTLARILAHPLCGDPGFLRASPPDAAVDQGALPELYALRHLYSLYTELHQRPEIVRALGVAAGLLPQPARLRAWWPALRGVSCPDAAQLRTLAGRLETASILARTARLLLARLARGPVMFERYRTITYWFLREAMLFGTPSHPSMYFDRVDFQNIANTGLFLLWHLDPASGAAAECRALMQVAGAAVEVHLRHLTPWAGRLYAFPSAQLADYRRDLSTLQAAPDLVRWSKA